MFLTTTVHCSSVIRGHFIPDPGRGLGSHYCSMHMNSIRRGRFRESWKLIAVIGFCPGPDARPTKGQDVTALTSGLPVSPTSRNPM